MKHDLPRRNNDLFALAGQPGGECVHLGLGAIELGLAAEVPRAQCALADQRSAGDHLAGSVEHARAAPRLVGYGRLYAQALDQAILAHRAAKVSGK